MDPFNKKSTRHLHSSIHQPISVGELHNLLQAFKVELLKEIKVIVLEQPKPPARKWLKNKSVAQMLGVSAGTLQTLRDNGTIPHSRIGRNFYYDPIDIEKEIERRKTYGRSRMHQQLSNL